MPLNDTDTTVFDPTEAAIISLMVQNGGEFIPKAIGDGLTPEHFESAPFAAIFALLAELSAEGEATDPTSVYGAARSRGRESDIGGTGLLVDLQGTNPPPSSWRSYVTQVSNAYAQRIARDKLLQVVNNAASTAPDAIVATVRAVADQVAETASRRRVMHSARESVQAWMERFKATYENGETPGLSTGIPCLDSATGGLRAGEFWVVSAKTSGGKSVLCLQIAASVLRAGKSVLVVTLELSHEEVIGRLISTMGRVSYQVLTNPREHQNRGALQRIQRTSGEIIDSRLHIIDAANLTVEAIISQAKELSDSDGLDLLIVDYIQLVDGIRGRHESREQEISRISRRLKQAAKALGIPIVSPSQLNDDGRLRESRAIGHDCDNHLMIFENGVKMDKARNAKRDTILPLVLNGEFQRFDVVEHQPEPPPPERDRGGYRRRRDN